MASASKHHEARDDIKTSKTKDALLSFSTLVFILDLKGKVLISRNYRGDIPMSAVEKFMPLV